MKINRFWGKVKIQKKLFTTLLAIITVPILFFGAFLLVKANESMVRQCQDQVTEENARARAVFFDLTTNIYNISENFTSDSVLADLLSRQYADETEVRRAFDAYDLISSTLARQTSLYDICIYTNNSTIRDYAHFSYAGLGVREKLWYQFFLQNEGTLWSSQPNQAGNNVTLFDLVMYRKIPLPSIHDFAVLKITVSDNYLRSRLNNKAIPSTAYLNGGSPFYYSDLTFDGTFTPPSTAENPYMQSTDFTEIDGQKYVRSVSTLQPYRSDGFIYILSYSKNGLQDISRLTWSYTLILLLVLFIPCFLLYFYTQYFSSRISLLRSAMHQAALGDYNIISSFAGNDELSETFNDLLLTVRKIEEKESLLYENQLREQKLTLQRQELEKRQQQMEYKVLASQMNPHFLYNTLEMIRMKAVNADDFEAANAIKLLGKYLRHSLDNTGTTVTTLSKELQYIELYLTIQQLRFKQRINYDISVDPEIEPEKVSVLPFLLQPLIENSVSHGLEHQESKGFIQVNIFREAEDFLYITVKDNGRGMTPEELAALRRMICTKDETKTKSIGLYNINQRIRLCCGPEYGMTITSRKWEGTCVSLKLPYLE